MKTPWFVRGDVDGFFGLFIDNLLQLMLVVVLSTKVAGLPPSLVVGRILPGAAVSILSGNVFYAWQAAKTGRRDATALPFGINTPSLLAFIFLIMGPVYSETKDPILTWHVGLSACLIQRSLRGLRGFRWWVVDVALRPAPRCSRLSRESP